MRKIVLLFLLSTLGLIPAQAQQKYVPLQLGSKPGAPAPQSCVATYKIISPVVKAYPHPDSWTWIMACDDLTWTSLLQHLGYESAGQYTYALTDQKHQITYVRAQGILNPTQGPDSAPEHVITHELAHIYLHSSDERRADAQATAWQKSNQQPVLRTVGGQQ